MIRCQGMVFALARSADGTMMASAGAETLVRLLDPSTAANLHRLEGHETSVYALTFSPDGRTLATGNRDGVVRFWDTRTGEMQRSIRAAAGTIASIAFAPDGKSVATADRGRLICRLWNVETGQEIRPTDGHSAGITTLAFAPDGKTLFSGAATAVFFCGTSPPDASGTPLAPHVMLPSWPASRRTARRWPRSTKPVEFCSGTPKAARSRDSFMYSAVDLTFSAQGQPRIWTVVEPSAAKASELGRPQHSSDLFLIDLATKKTLHSFQMNQKFRDNFGRLVPNVPAQVPGHLSYVTAVALSHQGTLAATGSQDRTIVLWDLRGQFVAKLPGHGSPITALAFTADDRLLASADVKGSIFLWETAGRSPVLRVPTVRGEVRALRFSLDGRTLFWADASADVHRWDIVHGHELPPLRGHRDSVTALAFSADGRLLASGSNDTTVLLWNWHDLPGAAKPEATDLKDLDRLWTALAEDTSERVYQIIWQLTARPTEAVAFLQKRMPLDGGKQKTIAQRIAELDAKQFRVRQEASLTLENTGELARPELLQALQTKPPLEVRRRIEDILRTLDRAGACCRPTTCAKSARSRCWSG